MRTWIDACAEFAAAHTSAAAFVNLLRTFADPFPRGGPSPPAERGWPGDFEALERELLAAPLEIAVALEHDVDSDQALMFQRRLLTVDATLAEYGGPVGRMLRTGLRARATQILAAAPPRASRIRALADFYYSQVGVLRAHEGPPLATLVADSRWRGIAPGVEALTIEGASAQGPVHVNVLRAELARVRLAVEDCRDTGGLPFAAYATARGALAAFSGGFFLYSEPDIAPPSQRHDPVGLLVSDGRVVSPPVFRRGALLVGEDGSVDIRRVALLDLTVRVVRTGESLDVGRAMNRAHGRTAGAGLTVAVVGDRVVAVGEALEVPLNGYVVPAVGVDVQIGDALDYGPLRTASGATVHDAIAGGPLLLHEGVEVLDMRADEFWGSAPPVTFSQDETGDRNLLPRQAVGLDDHDRLVVAAIDGRNLERALGMTMGNVAELMALLGCRTATNLDGGSSKRFVLQGETLDLPSTEIIGDGPASPAVRPVYTALFVHTR